MEWTNADKINVINDYYNNVKLIDIGFKYGISGDSVAYYLKQWGIPARDRRKYQFTEEDYEFLKREYPSILLEYVYIKKYISFTTIYMDMATTLRNNGTNLKKISKTINMLIL